MTAVRTKEALGSVLRKFVATLAAQVGMEDGQWVMMNDRVNKAFN